MTDEMSGWRRPRSRSAMHLRAYPNRPMGPEIWGSISLRCVMQRFLLRRPVPLARQQVFPDAREKG